METLFLRVISLSLTCSAIILPLLLLSRTLRSRYAARTLYFVWLFLAVRLLVPVRFELPTPTVAVEVPAYTVEVPVYQTVQAAAPLPAGLGEHTASPVPRTSQSRAVSVTVLWASVWVIGAVSVLSWQWIAYLLCRRKLLRRAETVEMALPPRVRAVRTSGAQAPMMLGVVCPVLVLPDVLPDDATLEIVLRHELCHLRRRDVAYKTLMVLMSAVYWFNPLMWLMAAEAGRNIELCCDDDVLKNADRAERRRYGEILLASSAEGRMPAFATRFGSPKSRMKERLGNLFDTKKTGVVLVCVLLAIMLVVGSVVVLQKEEDDTRYQSERYGFSLQLPKSWQGNYTALENTEVDRIAGGTQQYVTFMQKPEGDGTSFICTLLVDDSDNMSSESEEKIIRLGEGGGKVFSLMFFDTMGEHNAEYNTMYADALRLTAANFVYMGPNHEETPTPSPIVSTETFENDSTANLAAVGDKTFGVDFPQVDYVSEYLLIFHDYWGLAVYDFPRGQITHVLDTPSIEMNLIQGDRYTEVKLSADLTEIYLYNTPDEHADDSAWRYDLASDVLYRTSIIEAKAAEREKSAVAAGSFFFPEGTEEMVIGNLVYRAADGTEYQIFGGGAVDTGAGWQWPLAGHYAISATFGARIHPITGAVGNHTGTDIAAPEGTPVQAARGGSVVECGYNGEDGNYVKLNHGNGCATRYCQLSELTVVGGQNVEQGQTIGYVGATGNATGAHLHYELWNDGGRGDVLTKYPALKFTYR